MRVARARGVSGAGAVRLHGLLGWTLRHPEPEPVRDHLAADGLRDRDREPEEDL